MLRNRLVFVFAMSVALLVSVPLTAHHTGSTLLSEKAVTLKGTVQSWLWSNPHCLLKLAVTGGRRPGGGVGHGDPGAE